MNRVCTLCLYFFAIHFIAEHVQRESFFLSTLSVLSHCEGPTSSDEKVEFFSRLNFQSTSRTAGDGGNVANSIGGWFNWIGSSWKTILINEWMDGGMRRKKKKRNRRDVMVWLITIVCLCSESVALHLFRCRMPLPPGRLFWHFFHPVCCLGCLSRH